MFKSLIKFFKGPTSEESYQAGRKMVDEFIRDAMANGRNPAHAAEHMWAMGFGGFNTTVNERQFDRGVQDKLSELGYECPY